VEREDLGSTSRDDQKKDSLGNNTYWDEWGIIWRIEPRGEGCLNKIFGDIKDRLLKGIYQIRVNFGVIL